MKRQQGPKDKFFGCEESEAQRGRGTWPRSQGCQRRIPGTGHVAPGRQCSGKLVMLRRSQNALLLVDVPRKSFFSYKY